MTFSILLRYKKEKIWNTKIVEIHKYASRAMNMNSHDIIYKYYVQRNNFEIIW